MPWWGYVWLGALTVWCLLNSLVIGQTAGELDEITTGVTVWRKAR